MKIFYRSSFAYKFLGAGNFLGAGFLGAGFFTREILASIFLSAALISSSYAADIPPPPTLSNEQADEKTSEQRDSSVPSPDNNDVTIIQKKDATIEEVRVNGKLRYAKITPKKGPPYYLYDSNGDGILDATETDIKKANVNQWILMQW